ncbi:MAG: FkbM family methyltransferase [bacterium]|nr:FkbM family methyltransferase [bacterium]
MKTLLKKIIRSVGLDLRRYRPGDEYDPGKRTMESVLANIRRIGFRPGTVVDVGVAGGTYALYETFPEAKHLLVEPLKEFNPELEKICEKFDASYVNAAAGSEEAELSFNVHVEHLEGSSFYKEEMGASFDGEERKVQCKRVDKLVRERSLPGPYILKADVQGGELDVVDGAAEILDECEIIILEISTFYFMKGAPDLFDTAEYMKKKGYVIYDIFDLGERPLDGALAQMDIAFVKENGLFRTDHSFARAQQWREMTGKTGEE